MILDTYQMLIINLLAYGLFFFMLLNAIYYFGEWVLAKQKRWQPIKQIQIEQYFINSKRLMKLFGIDPLHTEINIRKQLLLGCGSQMNVLFYTILRRLLITISTSVLILSYFSINYPVLIFYLSPVYTGISTMIIFIFLLFDKKILEEFRSRRREKIVKEIYLISNHLLYYTNSHINLHAKLSHCIPFTKTIRQAIEMMLNEWYQDQEIAINQFKNRLNTDEAFSFAETLNVIRLNESDNYYDLLRQRIQDFKERIELSKDSRKETLSYILFVIAGIPIMNTFRVFLYPWIAEGQKLFNGIN
jgi:hypothetical protein